MRIWFDGPDRKIEQTIEAEVLREMMERLWQDRRVVNPRRVARYVKPMNMGSSWGYQDEIFGD